MFFFCKKLKLLMVCLNFFLNFVAKRRHLIWWLLRKVPYHSDNYKFHKIFKKQRNIRFCDFSSILYRSLSRYRKTWITKAPMNMTKQIIFLLYLVKLLKYHWKILIYRKLNFFSKKLVFRTFCTTVRRQMSDKIFMTQ